MNKYGVWVYIAGHQGWAKGCKDMSYADAVKRADALGRQDIAAVVKLMPPSDKQKDTPR